MGTTETETTAAIEARLAAAYPSFNVSEGVVQMQADIQALLAVVARLEERDAVYPPTAYYEGGAARRAGQPDTPPYATQAAFTAWRHGWATHEALMAREAALAALVAVDPIVRYGSADYDCHYCEVGAPGSWWATRPEEVEHSATCAWILAKKALGEPPG